MTKVMLIVALGAIALILIAVVSGKNPIVVLRGLIERLTKKDEENTPESHEHKKTNSDGTTLFPLLYLYQVGADGKIFYKHEIRKCDFENEEGEYVGLPVSRPNAVCKGLKLHGETGRNGQYNEKDPNTLNALSVNKYAVAIGMDNEGFYGEVTNPDSIVYVLDKDNKKIRIAYGEHFEINDGTYVLINHQLLSFAFPRVAEIPLGKIVDDVVNDTPADNTAPVLVKDIKKEMEDIVIKARNIGDRLKNKNNDKKESSVSDYKVTRGFPMDEDDF